MVGLSGSTQVAIGRKSRDWRGCVRRPMLPSVRSGKSYSGCKLSAVSMSRWMARSRPGGDGQVQVKHEPRLASLAVAPEQQHSLVHEAFNDRHGGRDVSATRSVAHCASGSEAGTGAAIRHSIRHRKSSRRSFGHRPWRARNFSRMPASLHSPAATGSQRLLFNSGVHDSHGIGDCMLAGGASALDVCPYNFRVLVVE